MSGPVRLQFSRCISPAAFAFASALDERVSSAAKAEEVQRRIAEQEVERPRHNLRSHVHLVDPAKIPDDPNEHKLRHGAHDDVSHANLTSVRSAQVSIRMMSLPLPPSESLCRMLFSSPGQALDIKCDAICHDAQEYMPSSRRYRACHSMPDLGNDAWTPWWAEGRQRPGDRAGALEASECESSSKRRRQKLYEIVGLLNSLSLRILSAG
eukprot:9504055-Pyramimonas_sp.AAC.2